MEQKDKAIRFLVSILKEVVTAYDYKQNVSKSSDAFIAAEISLNEKLSAARAFLNQISKSTLHETTSIGESLDVQVTRGNAVS